MRGAERKAAIAAYKEKAAVAGVYAIRCAASGEVWVGPSRSLERQQNGLWFTLRQGRHPNRGLQAAWAKHGEPAFSFEPLERLPQESSDYLREAALKARLAFWRAELDAMTA